MEGLSKLTDSILPIIVLVVIAGARIITRVMRQARDRNQSQKQEDGAQPDEPPQKGVQGVQPWEDEYRDPAGPVTIEEAEQADPDDEFSAWSLSVDDEESVNPAPVVPSKPAEISVFTALSSTSAVPVSREVPAWLQSPPTEAPAAVTEAVEAPAPEAAAGDGGLPDRLLPALHGNRRIAGAVESRIRSLPPLQQGIVWAEILGTPKGF
jgi:hypothetical protein